MKPQSFHIPIDSNTLVTDQVIVHKGLDYSVAEIAHLKFSNLRQSFNLVPQYVCFLRAGFRDGSAIGITHNSMFRQSNAVANLVNAFQALAELTFKQRLQTYLETWQATGYFDYKGVRVHADGTLQKKNATIDLRQAFQRDQVSFGRTSSYGFQYSYYTPFEFSVAEKKPGAWFYTNITINCDEDTDVIFALLKSFKNNVA